MVLANIAWNIDILPHAGDSSHFHTAYQELSLARLPSSSWNNNHAEDLMNYMVITLDEADCHLHQTSYIVLLCLQWFDQHKVFSVGSRLHQRDLDHWQYSNMYATQENDNVADIRSGNRKASRYQDFAHSMEASIHPSPHDCDSAGQYQPLMQ